MGNVNYCNYQIKREGDCITTDMQGDLMDEAVLSVLPVIRTAAAIGVADRVIACWNACVGLSDDELASLIQLQAAVKFARDMEGDEVGTQ